MTPGERLYNELRAETARTTKNALVAYPAWSEVSVGTRGIYEEVAKTLEIKGTLRIAGWYWVRCRAAGSPKLVMYWPDLPGADGDRYFLSGSYRYAEDSVEVLAGPLEPPK